MTILWPDVLKDASCSPPELRNAARGGGASFTGAEQQVYSDAGRWEISYKVPVRNRAQRLAWRAMIPCLREGEPIIAKVFDKDRARGFNGAAPAAALSVSAAARATTISLAAANLAVEAGVHFSIGQRLYRVEKVTAYTPAASIHQQLITDGPWSDSAVWVDDGSQPAAYTLKITPPLREAAASGTAVDFVNLVCLCVQASDDGNGDLALDNASTGTPALKLVEY